jgi:hypothetical protein
MLNTGGERDRMIAAQTTTVARRLINHAKAKRRELGAVAAESKGPMGGEGEGATTLPSPLSASTSGSRGMPSPCASLAAAESLVLIFLRLFHCSFQVDKKMKCASAIGVAVTTRENETKKTKMA